MHGGRGTQASPTARAQGFLIENGALKPSPSSQTLKKPKSRPLRVRNTVDDINPAFPIIRNIP